MPWGEGKQGEMQMQLQAFVAMLWNSSYEYPLHLGFQDDGSTSAETAAFVAVEGTGCCQLRVVVAHAVHWPSA